LLLVMLRLLVVLISWGPMMVFLPDSVKTGLAYRGMLSQWPPYSADQVSIFRGLVEEGEVILADAPEFASWNTDLPAVLLPVKRSDLPAITADIERMELSIAGVLVTPISSEARRLIDIFSGPWAEWPNLVLRGLLMAFDREMRTGRDLPFPHRVPLVGFNVGEG
jgi:hypothetical protein